MIGYYWLEMVVYGPLKAGMMTFNIQKKKALEAEAVVG